MKNKKGGVLMGGLSKEREISLRSGQAVVTALRAKGYAVTPIDAGRDLPGQLKKEGIEAAFIALHGRYGEDGTVQGLLEVMGIPYTGSGPLASAVCMDKELTKKLVMAEGVKTPAWKTIRRQNVGAVREPPLPLPVVVKPNQEGSTIGITIVRERAALKPALEVAAVYDRLILIEEYIQGTEVTVGLIDGKALPVLEIVPKSGFYDFTAKYTKGMTEYIVPARIPDKISRRLSEVSERIFSMLNLSGVARIDYIVATKGRRESGFAGSRSGGSGGAGGPPATTDEFFLEVNTIPGLTETSLVPKAAAAAGISFEDLCERMLLGASLKV